jgi:hypothetical protein
MEGSTGIPIEQKKNYLELLAVGYYVVGGLAALVSCLGLLYLGMGSFMMVRPHEFGPDAPPAFVGCFLLVLGGGFLILGWSFAAALIYAGRCIATRKKYTYALVAAVVTCLFTPFGTILGVLSLILLLQPDVKALFTPPPAAVPASPAG